jgi:hypothetical protein
MAVVLAVAVGSVVAGIAGAVLAVPLLAMLNSGIRVLVSENVTPGDGSHSVDVNVDADGVGTAGSALSPADVPVDPLVAEPADKSSTSPPR